MLITGWLARSLCRIRRTSEVVSRRTGVRIGAAFLLGMALVVVDPFGLDDFSDRAMRDAVLRIASPSLIGVADESVVALISDDTLAEHSLYWPLSYGTYASMLEAYVLLEPRAIVIDVSFADRRPDPTIDRFVGALIEASEVVPIYIVAASPETGAAVFARSELAELSGRRNITFVSGLSEYSDRTGWVYRLGPDARGALPVARALYERFCREEESPCMLDTARPMEVVWAGPSDRSCASTTRHLCEHLELGFFARFFRVVRQGLFPTWTVDDLVDPSLQTKAWPVDTFDAFVLARGEYRDEASQAVRGRVLFVGADLAASGDHVRVPIYQSVAGVFVHAMALHNLNAYENDYIKTGGIIGLGGFYNDIIMFCIGFFVQIVSVFLIHNYIGAIIPKSDYRYRILRTRGASILSINIRSIFWSAISILLVPVSVFILSLIMCFSFVFIFRQSPAYFGSFIAVPALMSIVFRYRFGSVRSDL